ncbi:MAG: hypothetical protein OIF54_06295 [Cohaesibacter sp.]|nr:hypothetical protein [Cohaesibacter sp.]
MNQVGSFQTTSPVAGCPTQSTQTSSDAQCILSAARLLFDHLRFGDRLSAKILRERMEDAFGASDSDGAWIWKDVYEAAEVAQIMMIERFGAAMRQRTKDDLSYLGLGSVDIHRELMIAAHRQIIAS